MYFFGLPKTSYFHYYIKIFKLLSKLTTYSKTLKLFGKSSRCIPRNKTKKI